MGILSAGIASGMGSLRREMETASVSWSDLALLAIATHKLGRVATKDLVTSPLRAPFVKFKKFAGQGEVEEEARGDGLQEAVGDLITCPYCIAPWIASFLIFALNRAPRLTKVFCSIFVVSAGSDFLNQIYRKAEE